ncbi:hypothetical protein BKA56DRAFT_677627 [Ilyonectria sp. MPI-CAGE-AT-0026]|nr:hypothetical protein BKA56DRAFT_677627 [Ilyonectria sp. MPI-CAGE-AT-0026]
MAPGFTNTNFDVVPDEPFTLYLIGCDQGCTIVLLSGPSHNLEDVETLTKDAKDSFTFTFKQDEFPSGDYAFKVIDNDSGDFNYSPQWAWEGSDKSDESVSSSIPASTEPSSSTEPASSTQPVSSSQPAASTHTTVQVAKPGTTSSLTSSGDSKAVTKHPSSSLTVSSNIIASATQSSSSGAAGLGPGPLAGIAVGVVAAVVFILLGLFLWWRRRRQKAPSNNSTSTNDLQGRIPELEQPKNPEMLVVAESPAELRGSTPPPPVTEMADTARLSEIQTKEMEDNEVLEDSPRVISSELPGETKPLGSELSAEKAPHEMDSTQQPKEPSVALETQITPRVQQQPRILPQSPSLSIASPDTGVSILPSSLGRAGSPSEADTISPVSPSSDIENTQTRASLMDKYAQLEVRKRRLLELKQIEEEQADLEAKLRATAD